MVAYLLWYLFILDYADAEEVFKNFVQSAEGGKRQSKKNVGSATHFTVTGAALMVAQKSKHGSCGNVGASVNCGAVFCSPPSGSQAGRLGDAAFPRLCHAGIDTVDY